MDAKVFHHGDPVIKAGGGRGTVIAAFRRSLVWRMALRGRRRPWGSTDTAIGTTGATERVSPTGFNVVRLGWRRPPRGRRGPGRYRPVLWCQSFDHFAPVAGMATGRSHTNIVSNLTVAWRERGKKRGETTLACDSTKSTQETGFPKDTFPQRMEPKVVPSRKFVPCRHRT